MLQIEARKITTRKNNVRIYVVAILNNMSSYHAISLGSAMRPRTAVAAATAGLAK